MVIIKYYDRRCPTNHNCGKCLFPLSSGESVVNPVKSCPQGDNEGGLSGGLTPLDDRYSSAAAGSLGWRLASAAESHPWAISTIGHVQGR